MRHMACFRGVSAAIYQAFQADFSPIFAHCLPCPSGAAETRGLFAFSVVGRLKKGTVNHASPRWGSGSRGLFPGLTPRADYLPRLQRSTS